MKKLWLAALLLLVVAIAAFLDLRTRHPQPGRVLDEASRSHLQPATFLAPDDNYFAAMDGGILLREDEEKGRNTWMAWTGGNDRFWDQLAHLTYGSFDLLKIVSSYDPAKDLALYQPEVEPLQKVYPFNRGNRWSYFGLINDPCFEAATEADGRHYGLWVDQRIPSCRPDPFADDQRYRGVAVGARGRSIPPGSLYGEPTGILGLRLLPNPDFDDAARKKWDPVRYYKDPTYFLSKDLVRPYRVGVTCAFCHAGFHPLNPPEDPENPEWENLSSISGASHFQAARIAAWQADTGNFVFQLMQAYGPGRLDPSFAITDHIYNPVRIPPLYGFAQRLRVARQSGQETLAGGALNQRQLSDYVAGGPMAELFEAPATVWTPHLLRSGADSAGLLPAINRRFLELGQFSEETQLHANPLVGGLPPSPIDIATVRRNSVYWQLTEAQSADVVRFLLRLSDPPRPPAAPGGADAIGRGKLIFADRCARCHSSKLPSSQDASSGEFQQQMRQMVNAPDFLDNNYLSSDVRLPVTSIETNACTALGANFTAGHIWDNFSSQSYKKLPGVGAIPYFHPETGDRLTFQAPAGGRGYVVPPSLLGLWSWEPDDALEKLLWPEKRDRRIDRTAARSSLRVPAALVPDEYRSLIGKSGWLEIGPIPAGTPVGLIASLDLAADPKKVLALLTRMQNELAALPKDASEEQVKSAFAAFVDPLLQSSNCPDPVSNRGHYFGTSQFAGEPALTDAEKRDLISFLKTF